MSKAIPAPLLERIKAAVGDAPEEPKKIAYEHDLGLTVPCKIYKIRLKGRAFILKWIDEDVPGWISAEARGSKLLTRSRTFRVPRIQIAKERHEGVPAFLIQEWIPPARKTVDQLRYDKKMGEHLAALHRRTARAFGLDHNNFYGSFQQKNTWTASFPQFFLECRLKPALAKARSSKAVTKKLGDQIEKLFPSLPQILDVSGERPALLHGDFSVHSLLADELAEPTVIQPALYYGCRETEIAYAHLLGFSDTFFQAYAAAHPMNSGHESRRPYHQLYPLLVMAIHSKKGKGAQMLKELVAELS